MALISCLYDQVLDELFVYSCVYGICLCAYVCADVFTHVAYVEAEVWGSILPSPSLPYCLRQGLSRKLELTVLAKNSSPGNTWHLPACHPTKHWGSRLTLAVQLWHGVVDRNSGPHPCAASTLPTEPSPQPQKFGLKLKIRKELKLYCFIYKRFQFSSC